MTTQSPPLKIVMVDDDQDDLFLTKRYFEKSDYNISFVGLQSAAALFDYIKFEGIGSIHVLLLDLNMRRMGGQQTLKKLQSYPGVEDVNIFIFSTSSCKNDQMVCIEEGAMGYFAKPANAEQAADFIKGLINSLNFDTPAHKKITG